MAKLVVEIDLKTLEGTYCEEHGEIAFGYPFYLLEPAKVESVPWSPFDPGSRVQVLRLVMAEIPMTAKPKEYNTVDLKELARTRNGMGFDRLMEGYGLP